MPSDCAGILGYHALSAEGYIEGHVYPKLMLDHGAKLLEGPNSVAMTLSHEVIEAMLDPWPNHWVNIRSFTYRWSYL